MLRILLFGLFSLFEWLVFIWVLVWDVVGCIVFLSMLRFSLS